MTEKLKAIVLAAGKGTRLHTSDRDTPKVMREVCGKPLLWHVLNALSFIKKKDTILVVGYKKDDVINSFSDYPYAVQGEQLGTGHAVMAAGGELANYDGALLVCYGDMPAIHRDVYKDLLQAHFEEGNDCTLLTGESTLDMSFGRIERDEKNRFLQIIEEKDCTPAQLEITELNTGVYVFDAKMLLSALKELKNDNAQGEYYITDVPGIMRGKSAKIGILKRNLGDDIIGVNTLSQLEQVEKIISNRRNGH